MIWLFEPRGEEEKLELVFVNQSINAQSFRKRMAEKSEVDYSRQLGGWFPVSCPNHRHLGLLIVFGYFPGQ